MLLSRGMALRHMIQEIGDASVTGMALQHMIQEKGDAAVMGNGVTTHDTGEGGCCCHGECTEKATKIPAITIRWH